jgi:hypothetical protein
VRRGIIAFTAVAVPAAAASLAFGACGGSTGSTAAVPAGQPGGPQAGGAPADLSTVVGDALDGLVDDGTITTAQQTAIVEALGEDPRGDGPQASPPPSPQEPAAKGQPPSGDDMAATVLDGLVEDDTLTSAQADAISQALADAMPGGPGARAPPSAAPEV